MDQSKTRMQGNDETQKEEQMEELMSILQQVVSAPESVIQKNVSMSIWSGQDHTISEDCIATILKRTQQVAQYDIRTNILYINAMTNVKRVQLFLETNSNFTDDKTVIHETVEIMKAMGKMLKIRNSMREELDVFIMCYIKNLTKKKDIDISVIEEVNEKIKHLNNSNDEVQIDMLLQQIKQTKRHEQREQAEGRKRKEIIFLENDKVQQKRKKIAQSKVEKNFKEKEESGSIYATPQQSKVHAHKGSTMNEGHFRKALSHGFLAQLEIMQQLVQELRTHLLIREDNQQTINKDKITDSRVQEFKLIRDQEKKAKRQQQKQEEIMGMINMPVDLRNKE